MENTWLKSSKRWTNFRVNSKLNYALNFLMWLRKCSHNFGMCFNISMYSVQRKVANWITESRTALVLSHLEWCIQFREPCCNRDFDQCSGGLKVFFLTSCIRYLFFRPMKLQWSIKLESNQNNLQGEPERQRSSHDKISAINSFFEAFE